jgi:hypothetical protein
MMKFYREGARRILTGQKKLSTILITGQCRWWSECAGKMLTGKKIGGKAGGVRVTAWRGCGKAEDGGGKRGDIRMVSSL